LGLGGWGWGFGVWAQNPNPQSPIPNPQSPIPNFYLIINIYFHFNKINNLIYFIFKNKKWEIHI